ncbi:PREDICTED: retrotransposon, partial [Prunus dulcis]
AISHIYGDRNLFTYYKQNSSGEKLYMGNASVSAIEGKGSVLLKFTFGKVLTLLDVLRVHEIGKNLVYGPILSKTGFKLVFESDKFILTKGGLFVGKGYLADGLFKLNLTGNDAFNNINKVSVYFAESSNIWHARLGH